jgi:DNA-binding NarL/FixJ family response regulator
MQGEAPIQGETPVQGQAPLQGQTSIQEDAPILRIVLADDNVAMRFGVRRAIEPHGMSVVAEVGSAAEALQACLDERPDICLLATELPGGGIEGARLIRQTAPDIKLVMLSEMGRSEELFGALRAGADGYLLMTTSPARLPHAIRGVANGEAALPRDLTALLIQEFRERGQHRRLPLSSSGQPVKLTAREFEVLERLRKHERTVDVAASLVISEVTVRRHVSSILQKLGVPNRSSALELLDRADAQENLDRADAQENLDRGEAQGSFDMAEAQESPNPER